MKQSQKLIRDINTLQAIEKQEWPTITTFTCESKGRGIKSKVDIEPGTVICDYHGELLSYKEGDDMYSKNESEENVYMFTFEYAGQKYYINSNEEHCKCHPRRLLKGTLNKSRKVKSKSKCQARGAPYRRWYTCHPLYFYQTYSSTRGNPLQLQLQKRQSVS